MRRLLSILLLAAFVLPIVAPALALGQDPDAGLPVCCRRHGQHHCTMLDSEKAPSARRIVAVCPAWPQRVLPASFPSQYFVQSRFNSGVSVQAVIFSAAMQDSSPLEISEALHPKRGPPAKPSLMA